MKKPKRNHTTNFGNEIEDLSPDENVDGNVVSRDGDRQTTLMKILMERESKPWVMSAAGIEISLNGKECVKMEGMKRGFSRKT